MYSQPHTRFWTGFGLAFGGLLLAVVAFNAWVDPYGLYRRSAHPAGTTENFKRVRLWKTETVRRLQPRAVVLGTSRADFAFDPAHPGWSAQPVFNFSVPGASGYEIRRAFEFADEVGDLRQALLVLDYGPFLVDGADADFVTERLQLDPPLTVRAADLYGTLFGIDAVLDGLGLLLGWRSWDGAIPYHATGLRSDALLVDKVLEAGGHHARFLARTGRAIEPHRRMAHLERWAYPDYRALLERAHTEEIDLRIVLSPRHVWSLLQIDLAGEWDAFVRWKTDLVRINEEVAAAHGRAPFPLWDFYKVHPFTTEPIPAAGDAKTTMRWHVESSHFRTELGNRVLDRVFGYVDADHPADPSFGVLLASADVKAGAEADHAAVRAYCGRFLADCEELRALILRGTDGIPGAPVAGAASPPPDEGF